MLVNTGKLAGRTLFITGASRGIGKAIALKAAQDGANIVIAAKTVEPHPKLPGTIYTAAEEIEKAGGKAFACMLDVRDEAQVKNAVKQAVDKFGGIDILVNNASAISLTGTLQTEMKRYDLMHNVNTRGTFLLSKECLPHLLKSNHAHILNISPPLNMSKRWFGPHVAYTMAKYGMSMCVLGMSHEFRDDNIAVNALWPRTAISTAAIEMLTGPESVKYSRKPEIMADAAYVILSKEPREATGKYFIDEEVLRTAGIHDFTQYACDPSNVDNLMDDFFLEETKGGQSNALSEASKSIPASSAETAAPEVSVGSIGQIFDRIKMLLSPELVQKTQAVYQFNIVDVESNEQTWFLDLKNGEGACGVGEPNSQPDAVLSMKSNNFSDLFNGKLKAAPAFMTGKLKIRGDLQKAMKLEKLMKGLKAKL